MKLTGAEKATVAAILTLIIGVCGQLIAVNAVSGTALHYVSVILAVATALSTTAAVYLKANTPPA
jgi:hypothetical protein